MLSPTLTLEALLNIPGTDRKKQAHVATAWEIYVQTRRFTIAVQQRKHEHSACLQDSVSSLLLKNKQTQKGNTVYSVQLSRTSVNISPSRIGNVSRRKKLNQGGVERFGIQVGSIPSVINQYSYSALLFKWVWM